MQRLNAAQAITERQMLYIKTKDLLHLIENTFDRKRIFANPSPYPNPKSNFNPNINPISNPNANPNPEAQLCFRTDEMTSFFYQV